MILENIDTYEDFRKVAPEDYPALCSEIRDFLIQKTSEHGGHLASNLGAVELTVALLSTFDLPEDKIIYDVGHQSYTHKILTGRRKDFDSLRESGGMSGFPKTSESVYDAFDTGHSTTSISAGLGLVAARDIAGEDYYVTAVIGDGSLSGGMAYEALNNASKLEKNFIIVLNDNNMSISENVGGMSSYLAGIRTTTGYQELKNEVKSSLSSLPGGEKLVNRISRTKSTIKSLFVPGMFFEELGIVYIGPVNGHDIHAMKKALKEAKNYNGAVLIHVITEKGAGYEPARRHPRRFHGVSPFDIETGKPLKEKTKPEYSDIVSKVLCELAAENPKICAITAAMEDGTGLRRFHKRFPERFFDVGIAEPHAVTFAAGMSSGGMLPVVAIYSSFMQRAFDQILHDVALTNRHVVFLLDRAGLVGPDGATHHGIFDISYLSQ
ncbi:MAG: 1-deoxy-D-xylulose-5-phosphate synthase, partial [Lachnospiraceae bacterium]|nr:1-deoxy-D-xylulose-5-phosphate synthase [Lachnospiraceae bacterium]